ncbi:MAG: pyruvate kinase [Myxococcota bacterium]
MRKTKIVCTLGPATSSKEQVLALIEAGMDCARLNFSHGSHEDHRRIFETVREAADLAGRPVAILQDLQGPKIRTGEMHDGAVSLEAGAETVVTTKAIEGTAEAFATDYEGLPGDVSPGDTILLDDGLLALRVLSAKGDEVRCRVVVGGTLRSRKGINLPGSRVSATAPTPKDLEDLDFGCSLGVDFVALSFVQEAGDIRRLRRRLEEVGCPEKPIIAKIERPQAVESLETIAALCEGLMVARGDLGVEMPAERVPGIQKTAIELANSRGKLVIIATQMLDSMIRAPRPTRAEVSDVANAVLDGADALMLSGETAVGTYPLEAAATMSSIISEVERSPRFEAGLSRAFLEQMPAFPNAAARAAVHAAMDLKLTTIAAFTDSGRTAQLISAYRPREGVVAFSPIPETRRKLAAYWGVSPEPIARFDSTDEMFSAVSEDLVERGICRNGEAIVIVAGVPPNQGRPTNLVKLHLVGS